MFMRRTKFLLYSPEIEITSEIMQKIAEQTEIRLRQGSELSKENFKKTESGIYLIDDLKTYKQIEKYHTSRLLFIVRKTELNEFISAHFSSSKMHILSIDEDKEVEGAITRFITDFITNYFHNAFMNICASLERVGGCISRSVSALIVRNRRIIAVSPNSSGNSGYDCLEEDCDFCSKKTKDYSKCICNHAEAEVIAKVGLGIQQTDILYCNTFPCIDCTKVIISSGIKTVYFRDYYKEETIAESLKLFDLNNVNISRLSKSEGSNLVKLQGLNL